MNKQELQHFAKRCLDQLDEPKQTTLDLIIQAVSIAYDLPLEKLTSRIQIGLYPEAKMTVSYLASKYTPAKTYEIGYRLRIDRSNASNAKKAVSDMLEIDLSYIARYMLCVNQIIKLQNENQTEQITA